MDEGGRKRMEITFGKLCVTVCGIFGCSQLSGFLVLSSPFGKENQGWRGRLVSSYGRHCVSEPENPSLTETWREVFTERLSRS